MHRWKRSVASFLFIPLVGGCLFEDTGPCDESLKIGDELVVELIEWTGEEALSQECQAALPFSPSSRLTLHIEEDGVGRSCYSWTGAFEVKGGGKWEQFIAERENGARFAASYDYQVENVSCYLTVALHGSEFRFWLENSPSPKANCPVACSGTYSVKQLSP